MKQGILIVVTVVLIALAGISWFVVSPHAALAPVSEWGYRYVNASSDLIVIERPHPGATVGKEFSIIGQARGYWYFEASFPVQVLDRSGNVIASAVAQAQSDWMTEAWVPFIADLKVPDSYIGPATLVLHKDNPSGEPQNEASLSYPIVVEY